MLAFGILCAVCGATSPPKQRTRSIVSLLSPPHPTFLEKIPMKVKIEYFNITIQDNITDAQEKEKMLAWAKKYNVTVISDLH